MTPKTIPFVRAFKERYKKAPTYTAATYDAIMTLKAVIEEAGTTNADKLVPLIEKIQHVGTGATATYDKRHDLVWGVGTTAGIAVQWQDGKKVPFWPPQVKGMQAFKMPAR
jgi:ABC-type branched-subunit amino acid transport system substrate-binding protein